MERALSRVTRFRAGEVVYLSLAHEETTLASQDLIEAIDPFTERRPADFQSRSDVLRCWTIDLGSVR